jgi:hypothetical protein
VLKSNDPPHFQHLLYREEEEVPIMQLLLLKKRWTY